MNPPPELRFDGEVVAVTGSGRGLGRAYVEHLAGIGARVVVNDIDADVVHEVVAAIGDRYATGVVADVATADGARHVVEAGLEVFGRIDAVVANAGNSWHQPFGEMTEADLHAVYGPHVLGTFHTVKAAWPHFVRQGGGRIVTTSSGAVFGYAGRAHYAAAKGAVLGFTNTVAIEGKPHGIAANTVLPRGNTRLAEPHHQAPDPALAAPAVAWLCHTTCDETRRAFVIGGGRITRVRFAPAEDVELS
ncbi:MAG: SDR family NAD(P)-dependent oxidoreductase [Acidimicrobiales bacterium]|nr:SDR family NAD(P)-dependent oxidoreductase [Acidimicrobiales bacterium]